MKVKNVLRYLLVQTAAPRRRIRERARQTLRYHSVMLPKLTKTNTVEPLEVVRGFTTKTMADPEVPNTAEDERLIPEAVEGQSGSSYTIEKVLQDKRTRFGRVCLARENNRKFVVKEIPQDFKIRKGMYERAGFCPTVRSLVDIVPDRRMFVFDYREHNLLAYAQNDMPLSQIKSILRCVLQGLAALHARNIVHNDIKANNILFNTRMTENGLEVEQVQLVDLEDAAHVEPDEVLAGRQLGNSMWRSPESHAEGPIEKHSDMFSFGLVCIYAVLKSVIMAVDESTLPQGTTKMSVVIRRQLSYFADPESFDAFMRYIEDDSPWRQTFQDMKESFNKTEPRHPFYLWQGDELDDDLKDLISGLTNFDPEKRLTAEQALEHRWFKEDLLAGWQCAVS